MPDKEEMKDQNIDQAGDTQKEDQPDEKKELTAEQKKIAELIERFDALEKKYQSDTDRLRTEKIKAEKKAEELAKEKMSEKEKAEFERQQKEKELLEREREIEAKTIAIIKRDVLDEVKLPIKLKDHVSGSSEEEIKKNALVLKEYINELVTAEVEARFKTVTPPPPKPKDSGTKQADATDWRGEVKEILNS